MAIDNMKPKFDGIRDPLDNKKMNGRVHNGPIMPEIGGASSVRVAGAPFKNKLAVRKPGDTI